ncbi:hypothetical protein BVX97_01875 [bacterium E08(2017)]|nr:hypothetical protein BVX97_01875 [bacterium E08(2017)]
MRYPLTIACLIFFAALTVSAQEPAYMEAATHPGKNQFYARTLSYVSEYEGDTLGNNEVSGKLKLVYGLRSNLAALLDVYFTDDIHETSCRLKYRLFKNDLGPLNTWMASVYAGVAFPGNSHVVFDNDEHPIMGLVSTAILNRHGLNGQMQWSESDETNIISINASYLYRIAPSAYSSDTKGAWYVMIESLNDISDDSQNRSDAALGILYEAQRWAAEASLKLPLKQDWPIETDHEIALGLRYLF